MNEGINLINLVFKNENTQQGIKYFFVGGLCTILDFVILYWLTTFFNINYLMSSIISFMSGVVLNYYLCILWIFKIRVVSSHRHEFFYYAIITIIGLGINTFLIWSITEFFGVYFMLSKFLTIFVTFWWNFSARKYFLHTVK